LSLLTGAEPRGLPGTTIDRVELQRAAEGHPLDDVIVHAHDTGGNSAVLEIQVKRSITFTPGDPVFRAVVRQIAEASRYPRLLDQSLRALDRDRSNLPQNRWRLPRRPNLGATTAIRGDLFQPH
jgi:hypothetical protein